MTDTVVEGPYFDELVVGAEFSTAPAVTLTSGLVATHQSIVGGRFRLALSQILSTAVTGDPRPLADPALVWDVAIGQSTLATHFVRANLYYRGLAFHRFPTVGDTLHTNTVVVALKENRRREDRPATGLAALRITTTDQDERTVLDFVRCAMLPVRPGVGSTGQNDDVDAVAAPSDAPRAEQLLTGWRHSEYAAIIPSSHSSYQAGDNWSIVAGDVVSSAPELARLTGNVARVHHDDFSGSRLVYGGHTIGLAMTQTLRCLPYLASVLSWEGCDHLGPVHEGDTILSTVELERVRTIDGGWRLLDLRVRSTARSEPDGESVPVLDWRFTAVGG
jgi:acyl dehydratase